MKRVNGALRGGRPAGISRRRACRPSARSQRQAVLVETPLPPRVPRVLYLSNAGGSGSDITLLRKVSLRRTPQPLAASF
jgi:hypothetical protein